MIPEPLARISAQLQARREPFVTATVVRVQHPTSVNPGATALIHADGTLDGFIGGICAQHSVRLYSLKAIESGEPLLLRIMPDPDQEDPDAAPVDAGQELSREDGAVTVRNPCLSGGAVEVFLEPTLPAPRLLVSGDSPIVGALSQVGPVAGFEVVTAAGRRDPLVPATGDFGLVVAAHGRDELDILRAGLELGLPYVALVASPKRGRSVLAELEQNGVARTLLDRVDTPAGLQIGADTPGAIAVAILAKAIQVRGETEPVAVPLGASAAGGPGASAAGGLDVIAAGGLDVIAAGGQDVIAPAADHGDAPGRAVITTAVDPICGMEVVVMADTPTSERDGVTHYFCCDGCRRAFVAQQAA